ncbi:MAG: CopG family transcriptional regulator [Alphaproteobacteria bacterium]|nr:MAG: CopG family transcriptional regulator [Alphaproteobacteria bacterium]
MATSIKIDDDLRRRIRNLAEAQRRSAHWIMREALRQYVEREEARESFRREALAAWVAFRENGRHLTDEEVRDWLARWGAEDGAEQPECHE